MVIISVVMLDSTEQQIIPLANTVELIWMK